MVRFWVRILGMQRYTIAKTAYLEALRQKSKVRWLAKIKGIVDKCGLGEWWNEGKGGKDMEEIVTRDVQEMLKNQECQIWWVSLDCSGLLKSHRRINGSWGEEVFWKVRLSKEDLKTYLD